VDLVPFGVGGGMAVITDPAVSGASLVDSGIVADAASVECCRIICVNERGANPAFVMDVTGECVGIWVPFVPCLFMEGKFCSGKGVGPFVRLSPLCPRWVGGAFGRSEMRMCLGMCGSRGEGEIRQACGDVGKKVLGVPSLCEEEEGFLCWGGDSISPSIFEGCASDKGGSGGFCTEEV